MWRQHYIDLGHGRIARCTRRLADATHAQRSELQRLELSFVALAITSAGSFTGKARLQKEHDLREYITTAMQCDLNVNDEHNGDNSVTLAAYHGFSETLIQLLDDAGCPLKKSSSQRNPIFAAIRNGQHESLEIILSKRTPESIHIVNEEEAISQRTGWCFVSLQEVIMKEDVVSAQLLRSFGCITMGDRLIKFLYKPVNARLRNYKKLERLLQKMHPTISNVKNWSKDLHWSFPTTDRETLNWLWHILQCPNNSEIIPSEMWLRVFSYFGRGWFACRRYEELGGIGDADVSERNII